VWVRLNWLRIRSNDHGNEYMDYIKTTDLLDHLDISNSHKKHMKSFVPYQIDGYTIVTD
jgi:hypothetical protein